MAVHLDARGARHLDRQHAEHHLGVHLEALARRERHRGQVHDALADEDLVGLVGLGGARPGATSVMRPSGDGGVAGDRGRCEGERHERSNEDELAVPAEPGAEEEAAGDDRERPGDDDLDAGRTSGGRDGRVQQDGRRSAAAASTVSVAQVGPRAAAAVRGSAAGRVRPGRCRSSSGRRVRGVGVGPAAEPGEVDHAVGLPRGRAGAGGVPGRERAALDTVRQAAGDLDEVDAARPRHEQRQAEHHDHGQRVPELPVSDMPNTMPAASAAPSSASAVSPSKTRLPTRSIFEGPPSGARHEQEGGDVEHDADAGREHQQREGRPGTPRRRCGCNGRARRTLR